MNSHCLAPRSAIAIYELKNNKQVSTYMQHKADIDNVAKLNLTAQEQMLLYHISRTTSAKTITSQGKLPNDENLRILGSREKRSSKIQYRVIKAFGTTSTLILGIYIAKMRSAIQQGRTTAIMLPWHRILTHYGLQYLDTSCFPPFFSL